MAEHNDLGKAGEAFATQYLMDNGFEILEKNYTFQNKEYGGNTVGLNGHFCMC